MSNQSLLEEVNALIKKCMKEKAKEKLEAYRYLKGQLLENKTAKSPRPELDVVIAHHKKLKDSVKAYPEGSPHIEKITQEISFMEIFLPSPLEESEVLSIIEAIKSELDAPNMGAIMKQLSPQIKGRFDGKRASELVKKNLS